MSRFDEYAFSAQPGFNEPIMREAFAKAVPLNSVVIYCYDPRVRDIPAAVARHFGEVYPGEVIRDEHGHQIGAALAAFGAGWSRTALLSYLPAFFTGGMLCLIAAVTILSIRQEKVVASPVTA